MNKYIIVTIILFDLICLLPFVEVKLCGKGGVKDED